MLRACQIVYRRRRNAPRKVGGSFIICDPSHNYSRNMLIGDVSYINLLDFFQLFGKGEVDDLESQ